MSGIKIHQSIMEYKQAYDGAGIEAPAYRITCKEHKALVEYCKHFMLKTTIKDGQFKSEIVQPTSMIAEYYGVQLEVVMIVDAYL